ncbi:hypothetical protein SR39_01210 [Methylobacterium radiotolerans]|jgi:hypothetical protein|nr:hypothetical protein SR39_01210 [Methylobacterium radiotolerans]
MSRRRTDPSRTPPVEIRVQFPADAHEDLKKIARISGLAVSTYVRALVLNHLAKTYANIGRN